MERRNGKCQDGLWIDIGCDVRIRARRKSREDVDGEETSFRLMIGDFSTNGRGSETMDETVMWKEIISDGPRVRSKCNRQWVNRAKLKVGECGDHKRDKRDKSRW